MAANRASEHPQPPPGARLGAGRRLDRGRSPAGLVDLGNRIVRTATVDLEVGKDRLNDTSTGRPTP
jgi:hypothetical protein